MNVGQSSVVRPAIGRWTRYDAGLLLWGGVERCGFVVEAQGDPEPVFLEMRNTSSDAAHWFEMDGAHVVEVFNRFKNMITGCWHTHPPGKPVPSETDIGWAPRNLDMYIISDLKIRRWVWESTWVERELKWN